MVRACSVSCSVRLDPSVLASSGEPCAWRAQLKWPLAMVVDGASVLDTKLRMANIELINTIGVSKENRTACLECHCPSAAFYLSTRAMFRAVGHR